MDVLDGRLTLNESPYVEARGHRRDWAILALCCAAVVAGIVVAVLFLLSGDPAGAVGGHGMA